MALSGEEAWEKFQKHHFDIVVTDYKMTGITGLELIQRIREASSPARIILLSGFVNGLGMTQKSTGADELIAKSNKEVAELLRAVKKLSIRPKTPQPRLAKGFDSRKKSYRLLGGILAAGPGGSGGASATCSQACR